MKTVKMDGVNVYALNPLEQTQIGGGNVYGVVKTVCKVLGIFDYVDAFVGGFKEGFKDGYSDQQNK
jgi:hypothetical protein